MSPTLCFHAITKRFPGVIALDDVSFDVAAGSCHALVGENGAGKSTLGKIVAGIYRPDGGRMMLDGQPASFRAPKDATRAGVSIVHQELAFCPNLSVAENLLLGEAPSRRGFVRWRDMQRLATQRLKSVGLDVDPSTPIKELSTAQEQLLQIAAAVGRAARIIIMDEPTSSLSPAEAERLFAIMADLRQRGVTILYVSHHLPEIMRLTDHVTVLRDGRHVATRPTAELSPDEIVRLMIGRDLGDFFPQHAAQARGPALLSVQNLAGPGFNDVSFDIHAGEIVGLAGLVGAGRSEIARAIFGIDAIERGQIEVRGRRAHIRDPQSAIGHGIGYLPEDRKRQALVLSMTCKENLSLSLLDRLRRWASIGGLDRRRERAIAAEYFARFRIRAPHVDADIAGLSGGNQQKIALAKWLALDTIRTQSCQGLARQCQVLILDEPTRGVDVGAKAEMHRLIDQLAAEGRGILLISSELPEILNLSTRILVLRAGRLVGELSRAEATEEKLMRLMAGVRAA